MKLLDLFCKAGGSGMGYHRAGFEVVGVDIKPQKRYPFSFVLGDALEVLRVLIGGGCITDGNGRSYTLGDFDVIHASPPCQVYSVTSHLSSGTHPDLVEPVRDLLKVVRRPYVIENVPGSPLENPVTQGINLI